MNKVLSDLFSVLRELGRRPQSLRDFFLLLVGSLLQALALRVFLIPARLASGGVSGLAQIINSYTGWPIGVMVFLGNLPLFLLGWRLLGGPRFALRTVLVISAFSLAVDFPVSWLPAGGITDDIVLNALYGGILSGIGFGLVYRGRGTSGGSDILARILSSWRDIPVSQSYLLSDAVIIFLAGLTFSWENALYALVMLYVSGLTAESVSQGSNIVRTAMIITAFPHAIKKEIFDRLGRGVTMIDVRGGYTGKEKTILLCVVTRPEVPPLKALTRDLDPKAFLIIGQAHEVRGEGFLPIEE